MFGQVITSLTTGNKIHYLLPNRTWKMNFMMLGLEKNRNDMWDYVWGREEAHADKQWAPTPIQPAFFFFCLLYFKMLASLQATGWLPGLFLNKP